MEPRFHTGDLAIVRSQSSYHVGEVVAYNNKMLHTIVLHRIIGRDGARYIFKGDNNNFVDFEHPAASQLIGALWLHIPGAGATLQSIRSPVLVGALVAVGVLLLTGSAFVRRRRLRRRERRAGEGGRPPSPHLPRSATAPVAGVVAVGLLLLLPFLVLALLAFTRSPSTLDPYTVPYKQSGALSYTAEAPPGPTYPEGKVTTGDPLFTKVVKAVDVGFAYRLHAAGRHSLGGKISLDAKVVSTDGWQTTAELAPPTPFHGNRAQVAGTLNLASLLATIRTRPESDERERLLHAHASPACERKRKRRRPPDPRDLRAQGRLHAQPNWRPSRSSPAAAPSLPARPPANSPRRASSIPPRPARRRAGAPSRSRSRLGWHSSRSR